MKQKNLYFYTNLLAWGLVLFLIGNYVFGWTTPTATPPSSNLPAPINAGPDSQTKAGNLTIQGNLTTGGFTMSAGAGADKVLTTDASGVASWQTAAGGGSGTVTNFVFTNSTGITGTVATPTITPTLSLALTSAAVGLGNVNNTADSAKSVLYAASAGSAPKGTLSCTEVTTTCSTSGNCPLFTWIYATCATGYTVVGGGCVGQYNVAESNGTINFVSNRLGCFHGALASAMTTKAVCCKVQ